MLPSQVGGDHGTFGRTIYLLAHNWLKVMAVLPRISILPARLRGHHVFVLPNNTLMVSYIRADILLRQGLRPREWRLHPEVVELPP